MYMLCSDMQPAQLKTVCGCTTVEPRLTDTPEMRTSTVMRTLCSVSKVSYILSNP